LPQRPSESRALQSDEAGVRQRAEQARRCRRRRAKRNRFDAIGKICQHGRNIVTLNAIRRAAPNQLLD
jgi:hypothetical protein